MGVEAVNELSKSTETDTAVGTNKESLPQAPSSPLSAQPSTHVTEAVYWHTDDTKLWAASPHCSQGLNDGAARG